MNEGDENVTDVIDSENISGEFNALKIIQVIIASMGIITNIVVVIVFLNDRKIEKENTQYLYNKSGWYTFLLYL